MGGLAVNKNKINTPFFSFKKPFIKCQLYPLLMLSFFNQTNIDNMTRGWVMTHIIYMRFIKKTVRFGCGGYGLSLRVFLIKKMVS
jgi:hypothetical protein